MSDESKCPKCGDKEESKFATYYTCGSRRFHDGGFWYQSDRCRVKELEQANADLRRRVAELEEVAAEVASMPGYDWLNGQLRLAEVLNNNQQARAAGGKE